MAGFNSAFIQRVEGRGPIDICQVVCSGHLCMPIFPPGGRWIVCLHVVDSILELLALFVEVVHLIAEGVISVVNFCE